MGLQWRRYSYMDLKILRFQMAVLDSVRPALCGWSLPGETLSALILILRPVIRCGHSLTHQI